MIEKNKIKTFIDLNAWKKSHELVLFVYKITESFPKKEMFALTSQMRRSSISITSNIAEGFSRHSYKEKIHFYSIALGSLTELQSQFLVARDVGYMKENYEIFFENSIIVHKLINGLIRHSKYIIHNT